MHFVVKSEYLRWILHDTLLLSKYGVRTLWVSNNNRVLQVQSCVAGLSLDIEMNRLQWTTPNLDEDRLRTHFHSEILLFMSHAFCACGRRKDSFYFFFIIKFTPHKRQQQQPLRAFSSYEVVHPCCLYMERYKSTRRLKVTNFSKATSSNVRNSQSLRQFCGRLASDSLSLSLSFSIVRECLGQILIWIHCKAGNHGVKWSKSTATAINNLSVKSKNKSYSNSFGLCNVFSFVLFRESWRRIDLLIRWRDKQRSICTSRGIPSVAVYNWHRKAYMMGQKRTLVANCKRIWNKTNGI